MAKLVKVIPATKPIAEMKEIPKTDLKWETITCDELEDIYLNVTTCDGTISEMFGVTIEEVRRKKKAFGITNRDISYSRALRETMKMFSQ